MKRIMLVLTLMAVLLNMGAAHAQTGGGYDLTWWTADGGGGATTGGGYTLMGTIGQPDAGAALSGGNYKLTGGLWPGASLPSNGFKVYLPIVIR